MRSFRSRSYNVRSVVVDGRIVGSNPRGFGECRAVARDICSLWPNEADEVMHRARFFVRDLEKERHDDIPDYCEVGVGRLSEMRLGLNKLTSNKTVASSDLDPDQSYGLDSGGVISQDFRGPSNHHRDQTILRNFKLQMQPQAVPVSDLSILTKPTYRKTVASYDLAPNLSAGLDSGGVIAQGFCGPFLLKSSCHDFEKVDKGRKMSSQLWVRMAGYRNYITYAGRNLNNKLRMAGY